MVNKQRVRRIKNLIYAFMILVLLLPVILMVALGLQILDTNREIIKLLGGMEPSVSQNAAPAPAPESTASDTGGGFVIEPGNASETGVGQNISGTASGADAGPDSVNGGTPSSGDISPAPADSHADSSEAAGGGASLAGNSSISGVTQTAGGASEIPGGALSDSHSPGIAVNDVNMSSGENSERNHTDEESNPETGIGIGINNNPKTGR